MDREVSGSGVVVAPKSTGVVVSNPGVVSRLAEDAHDGVSDVASSPVSLADGCVLSSANTLQHNCYTTAHNTLAQDTLTNPSPNLFQVSPSSLGRLSDNP